MPDRNLEIKWGGGAVIQTLRYGGGGGGAGRPKKFFRPFVPQFGPEIRGGAGPPGPSPRSATAKLPQTLR